MYNNTIIDNDMTITTGFGLNEDEKNMVEMVHFWGDGVLGCFFAIVGLIMNSLAIFILMTKEELKHITTELLCRLLWVENTFGG